MGVMDLGQLRRTDPRGVIKEQQAIISRAKEALFKLAVENAQHQNTIVFLNSLIALLVARYEPDTKRVEWTLEDVLRVKGMRLTFQDQAEDGVDAVYLTKAPEPPTADTPPPEQELDLQQQAINEIEQEDTARDDALKEGHALEPEPQRKGTES